MFIILHIIILIINIPDWLSLLSEEYSVVADILAIMGICWAIGECLNSEI